MNFEPFEKKSDCNPEPYMVNVERATYRNQNYRTELWTGKYMQMTLMCIPVRGEIGLEVHEDTDQMICLEQGMAVAVFGSCRNNLSSRVEMRSGDVFFVPAGTWHNVINIGNIPLRIATVYAPPHHPKGTVQRTKAEADHLH